MTWSICMIFQNLKSNATQMTTAILLENSKLRHTEEFCIAIAILVEFLGCFSFGIKDLKRNIWCQQDGTSHVHQDFVLILWVRVVVVDSYCHYSIKYVHTFSKGEEKRGGGGGGDCAVCWLHILTFWTYKSTTRVSLTHKVLGYTWTITNTNFYCIIIKIHRECTFFPTCGGERGII